MKVNRVDADLAEAKIRPTVDVLISADGDINPNLFSKPKSGNDTFGE